MSPGCSGDTWPEAAPVLAAEDFALLMAALGPVESPPTVAVGLSGGLDSLALTLLLQEWLAARGGSLTALTVDHRLRPESAAEARAVGRRMKDRGIEHRILVWHQGSPGPNLQERARDARYALMNQWCARKGVLHLALAHHLEDQAETLLLRLARGSGLQGLSAMAPVGELKDLRIIRPLLSVPRRRLVATLGRFGISDWVEDPSNRDLRQSRVRIRALLPRLVDEGMTAERLGATAAHLGRARGAQETAVADLLARAVALHPAGFARLNPEALAAAHPEVALRALAALLTTIGGSATAPRFSRLEGLYQRLRAGLVSGATLHGCRILPRAGGVLVVRETRRPSRVPVQGSRELRWDGRFTLGIAPAAGRRGELWLAPLGRDGWAEARRWAETRKAGGAPQLSRVCSLALPALYDRKGLLEVPLLGLKREPKKPPRVLFCRFRPKRPLTSPAFTVV